MKVIGISGGFGDAEGFKRSGVNDYYVQAVLKAGATPLILPICQDEKAIETMVDLCDGFILSGGVDIHPMYYHEEISNQCEDFDVLRDQFEWLLLEAVEKKSKPVLGICRGAQLLNVFYGGTLYQDLSMKDDLYVMHRQKGSRGFGCHQIQVVKDTFLSEIYNHHALVNSYHHQAVKDLAPLFNIVATSLDGVVEAFENQSKNIYAVQFHPEMMVEHDLRAVQLFKTFLERVED